MQARALAAGAALLISMTHTASAAVWGFGDSNLDNGWFMTAPYSGEIKYDTYLSQASVLGIGKQTNNPGPMAIEVLTEALGLPTALPANRKGGTNYAVSGAKNFDPNTTTNGGFPNAVPTATQFTNHLASHTPGANDVFLIDSGANDIGYALTLNPTDRISYLQTVATRFAKAIKSLQNRGATHLIIVGQPEDFGSIDAMDARKLYDATLQSSLGSFGVVYAWGDRNGVRHDIVNDTRFHMSVKFHMQFVDADPTNNYPDVACSQPPNFARDWAILCSPNSPVSNPKSFAQQTLFADQGHWASNGQKILGSYYYCLVKANWPSLVPPPPTFPRPPQPPYPCGAFTEFSPRSPPL